MDRTNIFSKYINKDDEKKKPSQVAADQVKNKDNIFNKYLTKPTSSPAPKPQPTLTQPREKKPQQSFVDKAKQTAEAVKQTAFKAIDAFDKFLFGRPEIKSPLPSGSVKPQEVRMSDDDYFKAVPAIQQLRQEAVDRLYKAEKELQAARSNKPGIFQPSADITEKQQQAGITEVQAAAEIPNLKQQIEIYDQFLGKEKIDRGFVQSLWNGIKKPGDTFIPFVKDTLSIDKFVQNYQAVKAYEKGEKLTDYQKSLVKNLQAEAITKTIDNGFGYKVGEVVVGMPKYALEFAMTGGAYATAKTTAIKAISRVQMPAIAKNIVGASIGALTQNTVLVPQWTNRTLEYMLPEYELVKNRQGNMVISKAGGEDKFKDALRKGYLGNLIEIASERMGVIVEEPVNFLMKATLGKFAVKNGIKTIGALADLAEKVGWNGIIGEVFEEEIGEVFQAPLEERKYNNPFTTPEGQERLLVETLGIGAFGGIGFVSDTVISKALDRKSDYKAVDLPVEKPAESKTANLPEVIRKKLEAPPAIAGIEDARNYTSAADFAEARYSAKETDQIGTIDSSKITARDPIDKEGITYKETVQKLQSNQPVEPIEVEMKDGKLTTVDGSNRLGAAQDQNKPIPVIYRGSEKIDGLQTFKDIHDKAAPQPAAQTPAVQKTEAVTKIEPKTVTEPKPVTEDYYAYDVQSKQFSKVTGRKVIIDRSIDTFAHKDGGKWVISEGRSGLQIASGDTRAMAIESAKKAIESTKDNVPGLINKAVEKNGESPRYSAPVAPAADSIEAIQEKAEGWKTPGMRKQFDIALGDKNAARVKELLPEVPADYKKRFQSEIDAVLAIIKSDEKPDDSRNKPTREALPDTQPVGEGESGNTAGAAEKPGESVARGKSDVSGAGTGERSNARITQSDINRQIEDLVKSKGDDAAKYTQEEKDLLKKYTGAGGLEKSGAEGRGLLDEYYTPKEVVDLMWQFLPQNEGMSMIEPSVGTGRFLEKAPQKSNVTGYEISDVSSKISRVLYPDAMINNAPFESIFVDERGNRKQWEKVDLVVGNPPYGEHRGRYLGLGEESKIPKYEEYFIKRGIDLLKPNGLLAYVVPSNFLRNGMSYAKGQIVKNGYLERAYRLPNGIFGTTDIGTDIIFIRKAALPTNDTEGEEDRRSRMLSSDSYFKDNPDSILGKVVRKRGRFGMQDFVEGNIEDVKKRLDQANTAPVRSEPVPTESQYFRTYEIERQFQNMTPAEFSSEYGKSLDELEAVNKENNARISELKQAIKTIKGRDAKTLEHKQDITEEINAMQADVVLRESEQRQRLDDYSMALAGEAIKYAESLGVNLGERGNGINDLSEGWDVFRSDFLERITERPYIETNWNTAMPEIVKEMVNEYSTYKSQQDLEIEEATVEKPAPAERAAAAPAELKNRNAKVTVKSNKKDSTIVLTGDVTGEEFRIWKNTTVTGELNRAYVEKLDAPRVFDRKDIAVTIENGQPKYYPASMYYQGNIYQKLDYLETIKDQLSQKQYERQKMKLREVLPEPKHLGEISLQPISDFVKDLKLQNGDPLIASFRGWLTTLPYNAFGGSSSWEINSYIDGRIVNTGNKLQNIQVRKRRREVGNSLFRRFLAEQLTTDERKSIEEKYNRTFNGYYRPDYQNIPLTGSLNATFKGSPLEVKGIQKEGAAFLTMKGVGLLGYDVGVGKTLTSIIAINEVLKKGWAKRPLVVVPNGVYLNWIKEIADVVPDVKINQLANLGSKFKGDLGTLEIEDGSISVITYDGLVKLGFQQETYDQLTADLQDVMSGFNATKRGKAKEEQKIQENIGRAQRKTTSERYFEDLGFDHVTIDEVHNFKNIFSGAKVERGRGNEYRNLRGNTSMRGIKAYLMTQYILRENNDRNVFLLSATPFTNSPLEIYSIISLMGKRRLEKMGLKNVNDFMSMFMELKPTFVVKADQTVKEEDVIERFQNLQQLQQLVTEFIDFRTGEEAGVNRPNRIKRTIPILPNQLQAEYITRSQELFEKKNDGGAIVAISELQNITLSPYLSRYNNEKPDYRQFVENSPKIKFALEAIGQVKKDNPKVGQVIYMPRGVETFPLIKQYLVNRYKYKSDQIGIISGGMSVDQKQDVQNRFNSGKIKVLIGTEAIKEGINLQENSTEIYHLHLPWNPTDMLQVEGRIWRQGNQWKNVRIHYPLVENSVDSFIFQKLETKEKRIKNLWNYKGDTISVGDLNFEEMKLDLITDPVLRVKAEREFEKSKENQKLKTLEVEHAFAEGRVTKLKMAQDDLKNAVEYREEYAQREDKSDSTLAYYDDRIKKAKQTVSQLQRSLLKSGSDLASVELKIKNLQDNIVASRTRLENLDAIYDEKLKEAEGKKSDLSGQITDYSKLVGVIAEENKTFFKKMKESEVTNSVRVPTGYGDPGGYADVPSAKKTVENIKSVEFPEILRIVQNLTGSTPTLKKFTTALGKFYPVENGYIKLNPEIFKDPTLAAKVLAHELGHLTDFLPDQTMARGNLIGRLQSLHRFMKGTFTDENGEISNKQIKAELKEMTQLWKPFNEDANVKYTKYRYSAKELYADAISVLFNDPALLEKTAPKFYDAFFNSLQLKPEAMNEFIDTWDLVNRGPDAVMAEREKSIREMFQKGRDLHRIKALEKTMADRDIVFKMKYDFIDRNQAVIDLINQDKKNGKYVSDEDNPIYWLEGNNYIGGIVKSWMEDYIQPVYKNMRDNNISWDDLGTVMFLERIANERGGTRNPIGVIKELYEGWDSIRTSLPSNIESLPAMQQIEILKDKFGATLNDNGESLYEDIMAGVPLSIANPKGFDRDSALAQLENFKKNYGEKKWKVLQDNLSTYRDGIMKITLEAEREGFYSPELIKLMKANPSYATFQVLDYLDVNLSASIKRQVGTLKDIANPAESTVAKTASIIRAIERNKVKKKIIGYLKRYHPELVQPAKTLYNGKTKVPIESKNPDLALFTTMENGKLTGYYIDPYIANTMNSISTGQANAALRILRFFNSGLFRPLFITFNLGFQSFNTMRDFTRFYKNTPKLSLIRAVSLYAESLPAAARRAWGVSDTTINTMQKDKMLSVTFNDLVSGRTEMDSQIEYEMQKAGFDAYSQKNRWAVLKPFVFILDNIEKTGNFIETIPKVAAYKYLNGTMPSNELASFIRTSVGSPDFLRRGASYRWYNEVFLFSNAIKEGIRSDLEVAFGNPRTRAGFWWKTALFTFVPKMIMYAALTDLLGDALKRMLEDVSEYDKTNYTIIPMGKDENDQTVYLRIPQDETGRLYGGLFWKALRMKDNGVPVFNDVADLLSYTGGQLPSLSPIINSASVTGQFLAGQNPYDPFLHRNVLTDDEFEAGGMYALKPFINWQINELGGGTFWKGFTTMQAPESRTWVQKVTEAPVLSNIIGRWIKTSSYGRVEKSKVIKDNIKQEKAVDRIENNKMIKDAVREYQKGPQNVTRRLKIERQLVKDMGLLVPKSPSEKTQRTNLVKKFRTSIIRGQFDPDVNSLISAQSNDEKVLLLKAISKEKDKKEMTKFLQDMARQKIISGGVINEFMRSK